MFLSITLVAFIAGLMIGTIGIGGVILAPVLTVVLGFDLHTALSASSFSFLFPGLVGTLTYAAKKSIVWADVRWLSLGVIPAALFGAWSNSRLETGALTVIVAGLVLFSGIRVFVRRRTTDGSVRPLTPATLVIMGLFVGFGSALTGTGGPVLLVPILLSLNTPALRAIGVSQAIQLPIAVFAVAGFWLYGQIDLGLGLHLGLVQALAAFGGAQIAHRLPLGQLRRLAAAVLIFTGILMLWTNL
jgi:hypothetical protein